MSLARLRSHACAGPAAGPTKPTERHVSLSLLRSLTSFALLLALALPARADVVERRPATGTDDAEERADLSMYTGSSDLELVYDGNNQTVGIRWTAVAIPPGATITTAWVQFTAKESQSEATNLVIAGQAADNPPTFTTTAGNISSRARTGATVAWNAIAPWTAGQVTSAQRTPELKTILQQIVDRAGWASGNALVLVITGTGHRTATAYNGSAAAAPLLHVEFTTGSPPPDQPPVAVLNVTQAANPALTVDASAAGSTDGDVTPIASYRFQWGDGTESIVSAPTQTASHTYASASTYTVTLTATDTGNLTSSPVTKSITVNPPATNSPPVAQLTVSVLASPDRTVSASAAGSTDTDAWPIASYRFQWGDGTQTIVNAPTMSATHTYASANTYTVTLTATDTGNLTSAPVTQSVTVTNAPPAAYTIDARPGGDSDDAEQSAGGSVTTSSSDIEMVYDGSNQIVGFRWPNLAINAGATITRAWVQFTADESQSEVTQLTIQGHDVDNAPTFTSSSNSISSRARTTAQVVWAPDPWTAGQAGAAQRTPDLKDVIQEVVSRSGWASGNAIALIISGTGHRTAEAAQGSSNSIWALLHVEYSGGTPPPDQAPVAVLNVTTSGLTANASAAGSTDGDATPIASYRFQWGDGTSATVVNAPTQTASHTYAAGGTYTVTLTATDTGGLTSAPVTKSISVSNTTSGPPIAVWASYYDTHHSYNPKPKPSPWMGASGVVFVGTPDSPSGGWDSSGIKIDNLSGSSLTVSVMVDMISKTFSLWGSRTIPAGQSLILAQTGYENFDGSDTSPAGCYGCDPKLCTTKVSSAVPVVNVTIGGVTTKYYDPQQTLNTNGVDYAGCPPTSGRNDESRGWVRIYPSATGVAPTATNMYEGDPDTEVLGLSWMAPLFPNPARTDLTLHFNVGQQGPAEIAIYDVAGRLVREELTHEFEPGQYRKIIPIRGLPSGMYYCTLKTREGTLRQGFSIAN